MRRVLLLSVPAALLLSGCMGVSDGVRAVSSTHARSVNAMAEALAMAANTTGACERMGLPERSARGQMRVRNDGEIEYNERNHYRPTMGSFEVELESDIRADSERTCGYDYRR